MEDEGVNCLSNPNDWNVSEIHEAIGRIAIRFPLLHCEECAAFIREWLKQRGVPGKIWRLSTRYDDEDFILSDRLEKRGNISSITENGVHYGVEVFGKMFDNLSQEVYTT